MGESQKRDKGDGVRHGCDSCLDGEKSSGGYQLYDSSSGSLGQIREVSCGGSCDDE